MTIAVYVNKPPEPLVEPLPPPIEWNGLTVGFEEITPQYALELVKHKHVRRNIKANKVEQFRRDMLAGIFKVNGDTIRIGPDGALLDGHHRLTACAQSGVPFIALVVRGAVDLSTIDTGTRRSLSDTLKLMGFNNTALLAAVLGLVWNYKRGLLGQGSALENIRPSTQEALGILDRHPEIVDSVRFGKKDAAIGCVTYICWLHWLCRSDTVESVEKFLADLTTGAGCESGNPAYVLRERLIKDKDDRSRKLQPRSKLAMMVKAWNSYRAGEMVARISWRGHGSLKEDFPRPDGAIGPEAI